MTKKKLIAELNKRLEAIRKQRDLLRALEGDVAALVDVCETANVSLQAAIDALSELV